MQTKKELRIGVPVSLVAIILFLTWFYPYSPLSLAKSFTYKPKEVLYNDQTYDRMVHEFKAVYEKELEQGLEKTDRFATINRVQYILLAFEQDWLLTTEPVTMNKKELDSMLYFVAQSRDILLQLIAQENYTSEEKVYAVDMLRNFLKLEDDIRQIKHGSYLSRKELAISYGNLREEFRSDFEQFVTTFYDRLQ